MGGLIGLSKLQGGGVVPPLSLKGQMNFPGKQEEGREEAFLQKKHNSQRKGSREDMQHLDTSHFFT